MQLGVPEKEKKRGRQVVNLQKKLNVRDTKLAEYQ